MNFAEGSAVFLVYPVTFVSSFRIYIMTVLFDWPPLLVIYRLIWYLAFFLIFLGCFISFEEIFMF